MSETTLSAGRSIDLRRWINPYIRLVASLGLFIAASALFHLPANWPGLLLFAAMGAIAELLSVDLYISSRSRVSVSSFVAIAGVVTFGPLAGALSVMAAGLVTFLSTALFSDFSKGEQATWIRRSAFNTGMFVVSAFLAGLVYRSTGGTNPDLDYLANLPPLILATAVYNLINLLLLIIIITLQTGQKPAHVWKQDFQWAIPIAIIGGVLGGGAIAMAYEMYNWLGLAVFFLPVLATGYSHGLYVRHTKDNIHKLEQLNNTLEQTNVELGQANRTLETNNLELMETLAATVDADDRYTAFHSRQVALYAVELARKLGLAEAEVNRIHKGALLHDIGKIGVKDTIVSKEGTLTAEEYNLIKRHPIIGAEIIGKMSGLQEIIPLVKYHHEHWDGRGYPEGLQGELIPLGARILAVVDAFEVLRSDRPYRVTKSFREACEEIQRCSGTQFDTRISEVFLQLVYEKGPDFFKNSAAIADQAMNGSFQSRYLKKSEVE